MVKLSTRGNLSKAIHFLNMLNPNAFYRKMGEYGQMGVDALSKATPKRTGLTASSWFYEISVNGKTASITWNNSNKNEGVPIALLIQYGHGMPNGGYVRGIDYINPALKPIFKSIKDGLINDLRV